MNIHTMDKHIGTKRIKHFRRVVIILVFLILAVFAGHLIYVRYVNNQVHNVKGKDTSEDTYMDIIVREGSANAWLKRDFEFDGKTYDIWGQTIDCVFHNNASLIVEEWKLTINIKADCFVNKCWNGSAEIHQYVGTSDEKSEHLDLMKCDPDEVQLVHTVHNGDLMIPLKAGDSVIYVPNTDTALAEMPVPAESEIVPGIIFYYLNDIDLSDYTLEFKYHMQFTDGFGFIAFIVLNGLMIVALAGWLATAAAYENAEKEIHFKQSGMASMSDIYSIIYYIDLEKDELTPIYADEISESFRPKDVGAREQLRRLAEFDAEEQYEKIIEDFMDISTVASRVEKGSIACEYISKNHGWTLIRFFPTDQVEGEPVTKVIFAIQDINEEKRNLKKYEDMVEQEKYAKKSYLEGLSGRTDTWLGKILDLNNDIFKDTKDEKIKFKARKIKSIGSLLSYTIEGGNDASNISIGNQEVNIEEYSVEDLLSSFLSIAETMTEDTPVEIVKDFSNVIPKRLKGDLNRIQRALIQLLSDAVNYTKKGIIRFAIYSKILDNKAHLLFSIKDSGGGIPDWRMNELQNYIEKISHHGPMGTVSNGRGLEVAACLLSFIGSSLNVICKPGVGTEFYFEVDQEIVDQSPIDTKNL